MIRKTGKVAGVVVAALFQYVAVRVIDGREVYLNSRQIVGIGEPKDNALFSDAARCIVHMTDGKFVSVTEDCAALKRRIEEAKNGK